MDSATNPALKGYSLLFAGMATVGVYVALSKPLTAALPVFVLALLRFAIAAVAMIPWLARRPGEQPIDRPTALTLFAQSLFGNFLFSIFMLYGVSMTSAAASGVILSTLPAVVALLSWWWLKEKLSLRVWLAVALAVAGVAMLTGAPADRGDLHRDAWLGNLLVVACVFCEAIYVILGKRLSVSLSARRNSALINLIGLVLMLPFGLWQLPQVDFAHVAVSTWALLVFYALAASMISTWLWLTGLRWVPASQSGVFTIALPIAASTVGIVFLGERPTLVHAISFACAALGIALIGWPARTPAAPVADPHHGPT